MQFERNFLFKRVLKERASAGCERKRAQPMQSMGLIHSRRNFPKDFATAKGLPEFAGCWCF